jgi:hypothetical protein
VRLVNVSCWLLHAFLFDRHLTDLSG